MRFPRLPHRAGSLLLGVWLVATGLLALFPSLHFAAAGTVLALLALAAGVLILMER